MRMRSGLAALVALSGVLGLLCPCPQVVFADQHSCCDEETAVFRSAEADCCLVMPELPPGALVTDVTMPAASMATVAPQARFGFGPGPSLVIVASSAQKHSPLPILRI